MIESEKSNSIPHAILVEERNNPLNDVISPSDVIIDEAQDNSDKQWGLVKKLTDDFLDENSQKTLFIVGDIKQSIYSFQGAEPQLFLETKHYFKQKFEIYKKSFTYIEWNFSFRVPQNTLNFIDSYFNQHQLTQNLMLEKIHPLNHIGFNQNTGVIININYNKKIKLKKISNVNKVNKLTFFKTKTNSLNCSTWNNLFNTKINNKSKIDNKMFHVEHFEKNNINTSDKSLNKNVPRGTFFIKKKNIDFDSIIKNNDLYKNYNNKNIELNYQNVPRGTFSIRDKIKIPNCSTWNNLKKKKIIQKFKNCSTWNNFQKIQNNNLSNNKYYKQLDILLNQEINIEQLIYQLKLIKKDLPYSILLLKIHSILKTHLNIKIINKLITIIKNLEKKQFFSIKNFNLYLVNNPIELEESSHKDGVKILTIHAAKGLESKTVILINNILEKQFSSKNHKIMQSMDDQLLIENQKESSRLLYVALTRTKEKLILINE